jgi:hypothetical protein
MSTRESTLAVATVVDNVGVVGNATSIGAVGSSVRLAIPSRAARKVRWFDPPDQTLPQADGTRYPGEREQVRGHLSRPGASGAAGPGPGARWACS